MQVIVVSNSSDPEMTDLRKFVVRNGGSILARHPSTRALTVQIRAGAINALSQRKDVVIISPNRSTASTASTIEAITGALAADVRTNSTRTGYSGPGRQRHRHRRAGLGRHEGARRLPGRRRRHARAAQRRHDERAALASWTTGVDFTDLARARQRGAARPTRT